LAHEAILIFSVSPQILGFGSRLALLVQEKMDADLARSEYGYFKFPDEPALDLSPQMGEPHRNDSS